MNATTAEDPTVTTTITDTATAANLAKLLAEAQRLKDESRAFGRVEAEFYRQREQQRIAIREQRAAINAKLTANNIAIRDARIDAGMTRRDVDQLRQRLLRGKAK